MAGPIITYDNFLLCYTPTHYSSTVIQSAKNTSPVNIKENVLLYGARWVGSLCLMESGNIYYIASPSSQSPHRE